MSDLITIDYARNAILVFILSGIILAFWSGKIQKNERLAAGLFTSQAGALGVLVGSVLGYVSPLSAVTGAIFGLSTVLLISHFQSPGNRVASRQTLFQIGFFLAVTESAIIISKTTFDQPRFEELLFGRIFMVSISEIALLTGVAILSGLVFFVLSKFLSEENSALFALAVCAGPIIPLLGVIPFAALVTLLPLHHGHASISFRTDILLIGAQLTLSSVVGVYIALQYGFSGAPTVTACFVIIAALRFIVSQLKSRPER